MTLSPAEVAAASILQPIQNTSSGDLQDAQLADRALLRGKKAGDKPSVEQLEAASRASRQLL